MRATGIPAAAAASSSVRTAIQARPTRESRRWTVTTSAAATSARANQYQGRRFTAPNGASSGRSTRSIGPMLIAPFVSVPPNRPMSRPLVAIRPMISPNASVMIAM